MSYRRPWTKVFLNDEFNVETWGGMHPPTRSSEFKDYDPDRDITGYSAFMADNSWASIMPCGGTFKLNTPINIPAKMPGERQKLLCVTVNSMYQSDWWLSGSKHAHLELWSAGVKLWSSKILESKEDEWWEKPPLFEINLDLSTVDMLDLWIPMYAEAVTGMVKEYVRAIKFDCEYFSIQPPVTAAVKITVSNSETGVLIKGATVAIMSGTRVVASGYTDSNGNIEFKNVEEGSYTLKIIAGGYYSSDLGISVKAPSVWYEAKIVPIPIPPPTPLPDWAKYAVVGIAALGAITIIPPLIRRRKPEEEKVIILR